VYDTYEGNVREGTSEEGRETVTVDDDRRRRSRFRARTDDGREIGVVVARELRAGDVLSASDAEAPPVQVALDPVEAVTVDLSDAAPTTAVALGHAAGNRHWDMAVRGQTVLFPAAESDDRIDATLGPHLPEGAIVGREAVSPALFDDATGDGDHKHEHGHGHAHAHGDGGGHTRDAGDDHTDGTGHRTDGGGET